MREGEGGNPVESQVGGAWEDGGRRGVGVVDRIGLTVASDAADRTVLQEAVRLLRDRMPPWDWVGIYLLTGDTLVIGPHAGSYPEHDRIRVGEGVCGTAVAEDRNQLVADVRELDNYLACSVRTRSELVVLIRHGGEIVGQFDIDSDAVGAFGAEDEALLEEAAGLVASRCAALARDAAP